MYQRKKKDCDLNRRGINLFQGTLGLPYCYRDIQLDS